MSDLETRRNRPIEETDKVILAAYKRAAESRDLNPEDKVAVLDTTTEGAKIVRLGWLDWDGKQKLYRCVMVKIFEGYVEIWAYLNGLINTETYEVGVAMEKVGISRLPVFTTDLHEKLGEGIEMVKGWTSFELRKPMENEDKVIGSSQTLLYKGVKDFVSGL